MTGFSSTVPTLFALQAAWLCGGALIGAVYFVTLHWSDTLLALGRTPLVAAAIQVCRFAFLASLLAVIAARGGALPLIAATAGILAARTMMTMRLGVPT